MDMIQIFHKLIRAEPTGDWKLPLQAVSEILIFMAASGHNYTKSGCIYQHQMCGLQNTHPHLCEQFINGLLIVRRSGRVWAGLFCDLIIEQALMRSLKTSGSLTRGRGMTKQQRVIWLLSRPACAEVNKAILITSRTQQFGMKKLVGI